MIRQLLFSMKAATLLLVVLSLLLWLDTAHAQAGAWALLLLSVSVGFIHGALDAVLMPQRFDSLAQAALITVAYGLVVVLLGWVLSASISLALWALLIMSAWHFGEPYRRWDGLAAWHRVLTRAVVGGAPVMLPVWQTPDQLSAVLQSVVPAVALQGWHHLAWLWLGLLVVWLLAWVIEGLRVFRLGVVKPLPDLRFAWLELIGCTALYAVFSPLMAFALYFGVYHAPVHIWRVWRGFAAVQSRVAPGLMVSANAALFAVAATTVLSWLLGAGLWWWLGAGATTSLDWASGLRWLIVAFAALTAPHLVVISLSEAFLTQHGQRPA